MAEKHPWYFYGHDVVGKIHAVSMIHSSARVNGYLDEKEKITLCQQIANFYLFRLAKSCVSFPRFTKTGLRRCYAVGDSIDWLNEPDKFFNWVSEYWR